MRFLDSRHVLGLVLSVLVVLAATPPARAICGNPRVFTSTAYVYTPGVEPAFDPPRSSITDDFVGHFWGLGFGDPRPQHGIDDGSFPTLAPWEGTDWGEGWVFAYPGYPMTFHGHWADSQDIDGCIVAAGSTNGFDHDECMLVLLADQHGGNGYFGLLGQMTDSNFWFYFAPTVGDSFVLAPIPSPTPLRVETFGAGSLRLLLAAPDPTDGLDVDPGCAAQGDVVVGYRVYRQRLAPGAVPDADRRPDAGWSGGTSAGECGEPLFVPLGDAAEIEVSCTEDTDVFLAYSLVFDSGFETPFLSADSTVIECRVCPPGEDKDGDGFCTTARGAVAADCDDADARVYPGAAQLCDGVHNDCLAADWPVVPQNEIDDDGDGYAACVKTIVLELPADNCPGVANPGQADQDGDGIGDACDPTPGTGRGCTGSPEQCRSTGDASPSGTVVPQPVQQRVDQRQP